MCANPPGSPPSVDDLIDSINESAKHITSVTITVLIACVYIAISVSSTSHERLLLGWGEFSLPLFDAKIPLIEFYIAVPVLLVLLHLHLLLQEYFLIRKMLPCPLGFTDGLAKYFFPALLINRMFGWKYHWSVRFLLRAMRWVINAILPLALLVWIQAKFLPYHSTLMTGFHRSVAMIDLISIMAFRGLIGGQRRRELDADDKHGRPILEDALEKWKGLQEKARRLRPLISRSVGVLFIIAACAVGYFCFFVAIVPGSMVEHWTDRQFWPSDWPPAKNLVLRERTLAGPKSTDSDPEHAEGVVLVKRDLRNADFTGTSLVKADFRGANLEGAVLRDADLRGGKFMPYGGFHGRFEGEPGGAKYRLIEEARLKEQDFVPTNLEGADLRGANLKGANFILAHLRGARLSSAHLTGVELSYADLREAEMVGAQMPASELWHTQLEGANLGAADLQSANLNLASLGGAIFSQARLRKANFRGADLSGARLTLADLDGAIFGSSRLIGANFRGASLLGASGLELRGVSLRQAAIDGICQPRGTDRPYLVDFREIKFPENLIRLCPKEEAIQGESLKQRGLLYNNNDRQHFMSDWPSVQEQRFSRAGAWQEDDYYRELVDLLMEEVCRNPGLALGLARDATERDTLEPQFRAHLKRRLGARVRELERAEAAREEGKAVAVSPCKPLLDLPAKTRARIVAGATEPGREP